MEACPVRLRPIIMTSFACIAAAIPEALSLGAGSETTIPMAVSIIGGVSVSTFLTLFVVPCVYELFSRIQKRAENKHEILQAFANVGSDGYESETVEPEPGRGGKKQEAHKPHHDQGLQP